MGRAELLARCSDEPGRLTRLYGTPAHASATSTVSGWMRAAGMTVHRDAIGNLIGRFEGDDPDAPAVLLGSHLDTVRDAGRWDGTLGVLVTRAAVAAGTQPLTLSSGAGHDAAVMASIAPVTMLFVRCAGGVSHSPAESVAELDVALAVDALAAFVEDFPL